MAILEIKKLISRVPIFHCNEQFRRLARLARLRFRDRARPQPKWPLVTRLLGEPLIESPIKPRLSGTYRHYRCNKIFKSLFVWLRYKGLSSANPLHTLRKEFGSRISGAVAPDDGSAR